MVNKKCRFCHSSLNHTFVNLGVSPLANSYLKEDNLSNVETFYPLHTYVCEKCYLVQVEEFETPQHIFTDYAYFSSFSDSWLKHAKNYVDMAVQKFLLNTSNKVIEIASNDGYLLQYFEKYKIPVLGVEPASNVACIAEQKGIPTRIEFFGESLSKQLVQEGHHADLIIANNVLAHVPNLHDFIKGLKILLKPSGTITAEFPHLLNLIDNNQFDTIYHEHFSYFSLLTIEKIFNLYGLQVYEVEEIPTHGGSLRIYVKHEEDSSKSVTTNVNVLEDKEKSYGLNSLDLYLNFCNKVNQTKFAILQFLIQAKHSGKTIVGYGAPAKGNTLLNYCGIGTEFISYTVDKSSYKQGLYLPGTRIPIKSPAMISETKPDYIFILPWNLKGEIIEQLSFIRDWGGEFLIAIPRVEVI